MGEQSLAIALGLISALTLALANMAVKRGHDILVARAILSGSAAVVIAPFALIVPFPDSATWAALAWSVPAHFAYQLCLIRAMQRGDLSLVFPIMRGVAPLLTAGFAMLVLREHLSVIGWLGLLVATGAVILFVLPARGVTFAAHPDKVALCWAFATAVGIALYNMADARGVRLAPGPFTYIVWLFMLDAVPITTTALLFRRRELGRAVRATWRHGAAAGALSSISFGSALYAFSLMEVAKVSALRETSVVWAALMGNRFLGEGFGARRIVAALMLAAGLVLLQFG
ncbi:EamA family transporter [Sphingomonas suaedae]|uniref:EamA family transporter n=1 Tax=Sphingomonas suaedae TaxID=2599297 RepID=A0A518RFK9_9SPHN|nr:DMT family transporter [Sphingomonas suaedae]QDX26240.1 EamA family transporter [Sphingomonas suaedae]